jgi:hypothetical protein
LPKGTIRLKVIFGMLEVCAQGHSKKLGAHSWIITFNGRFFSLPKGEHGHQNPPIQALQVQKMIRALEINRDCASANGC